MEQFGRPGVACRVVTRPDKHASVLEGSGEETRIIKYRQETKLNLQKFSLTFVFFIYEDLSSTCILLETLLNWMLYLAPPSGSIYIIL